MLTKVDGNTQTDLVVLQQQREKKYNLLVKDITRIKEPLVVTGALTELALLTSFGYIYATGSVSQTVQIVIGISGTIYARCLQQHFENLSCLKTAKAEINKQRYTENKEEILEDMNKALVAYSAASSLSVTKTALRSFKYKLKD